MRKRIICLLTLVSLIALSLPMHIGAATVNVQDLFLKKEHVTEDGYTLKYRLHLPEDYSEDKQYPVILFFHGAGEKGNDNETQFKTGVVEHMFTYSYGKVAQSIVIAPQCPLLTPDTAKWVDVPNWKDYCTYSTDSIPESKHMKAVVDLLDNIKKDYSTDESRWYVTGLSMGGFATWDIIVRHTEIWAAAVPVCGGADASKAERLKDMPIWTFHGLEDPTVPYRGTEKMVNTLKALGSTSIKYNAMAGYQHNIWTPVYKNPQVYTWLFKQSKPVTADITDTQAPVTEETAAEETTAAQTEAPAENKGCGSVIGVGAGAVLAATGGAVAFTRKKRKDEDK